MDRREALMKTTINRREFLQLVDIAGAGIAGVEIAWRLGP